MMKKIKDMFGIIRRFVAGSNKSNYLRLRFGSVVAVLGIKRFGLSGRYAPYVCWNSRKGTLYIVPRSEPNPHIVISGMSGFGKSTLFKSLLLDIRKAGVPCIIFDAHNEHADIVRGLGGSVHNALYSGINILDLDGASVSERTSELTRLFKEVYSLGYIQATKLSECLWYTYRKAGAGYRSERKLKSVPTISNLVDELNIFIRNSKTVGERNTLSHLKDRISLLNNSAFSGSAISIGDLSNGVNSFSLASMKSREAQLVYIGELLSRLYATMHDSGKRDALSLYIMIDEAQFLVDDSNNNSVIAKLTEEGRKYGVGVIIVTHAACTLNRKIMANSSTFATFYAREPSELNYIAKVLSGGNGDASEQVKNRISRLKQNEIVLISCCRRDPVVVSTPGFREIAMHSSGQSEQETVDLIRTRARRPLKYEELKAVANITKASVERLKSRGILDAFATYEDGKAEEWLMLHNKSLSIEHEVLVRRISGLLSSSGIDNAIIDNSKGPDISAYEGHRKLAIEYETGSKSFSGTSNMIKRRLENYSIVIMVVNDSAFEYYRSNFSCAGVVIMPASGIGSIIATIREAADTG
ncbi:MAG: ATP-binding protein [Candidatus Micrarchaeaceae archaeon]